MVPQLQHNSLISGGNFADANYITVLTPTEVLIYDGKDTHISVSKIPIQRLEGHNNRPLARPTPTNCPNPKVWIRLSQQDQRGRYPKRLWTTLIREKYTISPRLCRFPNQGILYQGHQGWQLCHMAQSHRWGGEPTLPIIKWNQSRPHARHQTQYHINKREETTIDLPIGKSRNTHHPDQKTLRHLHINQLRERDNVHRSIRRVYCHFQERK